MFCNRIRKQKIGAESQDLLVSRASYLKHSLYVGAVGAAAGRLGWCVCPWAFVLFMVSCLSLEKCPHCSTLHYIQGLLCFRAKYEFNFCTHEGTLCVCNFVPFWSAHLFSIQNTLLSDFCQRKNEILNLFISLRSQSDYLMIVRWSKI